MELPEATAKAQMDHIKNKLKTLITASQTELSKPEQLYFP
jgi:hypothetical protein